MYIEFCNLSYFVLKGTEIYDARHGSFVDLGILDVLQIFGRAGRPQFDKSGHGIIITSHDKLSHYLSLLTNQFPIESNFVACLADNLNAEVMYFTSFTLKFIFLVQSIEITFHFIISLSSSSLLLCTNLILYVQSVKDLGSSVGVQALNLSP
jgi:replicative superfamily II helicase